MFALNDANSVTVRRILVVGDLQLSRNFITTALSKQGFDLACVGSSTEALRLLERRTYALCLIALNLSDGSGVELAGILRQPGSSHRKIPIILFGDAWDRDSVLKDCSRLNIQGYLLKPLTTSRIEAAVRQHVSSKPAHQPVQSQPAESDLIDHEYLTSITGGDNQLKLELGELFVATANQYVQRMRKLCAPDAKRVEDWATIAHALKGASANLGANSIASLAREAETSEPSDQILDTIQNQITEVTSIFRQTTD